MVASMPLLEETRGRITFLTLNRPDCLNALDDDLSARLLDAFARAEANPDVLAIVLAGAGRSFCSGADRNAPPPTVAAPVGLLQHRTYIENGIKRFKPVVGAVQGYALGAGALLAVHGCDIVVAAEGAMFGFPEGRAGYAVPPNTVMPFLPFKISLEFMLLAWNGGAPMPAARACELGMINKVVPECDLLAEAANYAEMLCQVPPLYIKSMKSGHYPAALQPAAVAELHYLDHVLPQEGSADLVELRRAAAAHRAPSFHGR